MLEVSTAREGKVPVPEVSKVDTSPPCACPQSHGGLRAELAPAPFSSPRRVKERGRSVGLCTHAQPVSLLRVLVRVMSYRRSVRACECVCVRTGTLTARGRRPAAPLTEWAAGRPEPLRSSLLAHPPTLESKALGRGRVFGPSLWTKVVEGWGGGLRAHGEHCKGGQGARPGGVYGRHLPPSREPS